MGAGPSREGGSEREVPERVGGGESSSSSGAVDLVASTPSGPVDVTPGGGHEASPPVESNHAGHSAGDFVVEAGVHLGIHAVAEVVAGLPGAVATALLMPSDMGDPQAHAPGYNIDFSSEPVQRRPDPADSTPMWKMRSSGNDHASPPSGNDGGGPCVSGDFT